MTFKHTKFDSEVFRSLERVALDKGMITPEVPLIKEASVKVEDLSPTNDLMINVVKLCSGLRSRGFDKYADEVESKFFALKSANVLYDVSKETGEDLVDAAHPKGSHKLEDVDGDSLIETILDRHLKMIEVTNKKPTGKLANIDIINSVKIALAQDSVSEVPKTVGDAKMAELKGAFINTLNSAIRSASVISANLVGGVSIGDIFGEGDYSSKNAVDGAWRSLSQIRARVSATNLVTASDINQAVKNMSTLIHFTPSTLEDSKMLPPILQTFNDQMSYLKGISSKDYTTEWKRSPDEKSSEQTKDVSDNSSWINRIKTELNRTYKIINAEKPDMDSPTSESGKAYAKAFVRANEQVAADLNTALYIFTNDPNATAAKAFGATKAFANVGDMSGFVATMAAYENSRAKYKSYWGVTAW